MIRLTRKIWPAAPVRTRVHDFPAALALAVTLAIKTLALATTTPVTVPAGAPVGSTNETSIGFWKPAPVTITMVGIPLATDVGLTESAGADPAKALMPSFT